MPLLAAARYPVPRALTPSPSPCLAPLSLWFEDKADYAKIAAGDQVETVGVKALLEGELAAPVVLRVTKPDGSVVEIPTKHTMSVDQVGWLKAGSALNLVREIKAAAAEASA